MSENQTLHGGMGATWLQPGGPNTRPYYLGCYELADTAEPLGELSRLRVPDPHHPGKWREYGLAQGAPDALTTSLVGLTGKTADYLQRAVRNKVCPLGLYVLWSECGPRDMFNQYDVIKVLENAVPTALGESALAQREGVDDTLQTWAINARKAELIYPLTLCQPTQTGDKSVSDITGCTDARCVGPGGAGGESCDTLYAVTAATWVDTADVLASQDGGETWAATAATPFGVSEHIASVGCFPVTPYANRVVVARGSTDAFNPAEIAYSDNGGVTWVAVDVGTTLGDYARWNGALMALDMHHLWLGTDSGYVHFSKDGGLTWTEQLSNVGSIIYAVRFADDYNGVIVGGANLVRVTNDGGTSWVNVGGPAAKAGIDILTAWVVDRWRWFVGYSDGDLWYTDDGGATWQERALPLPTGITAINGVNDIMAHDEYILFLAADGTEGGDHFPVVYRSYDGGYTWESVVGATQGAGPWEGAEALWVCHANSALAVGDLAAVSGTIIKVADLCSVDTPAMAFYRYAAPAHAGADNGRDWANAWDFASIDWAELQTLAAQRPTYLFLDQGTYTTQLAPAGSGSSNVNRIYIMPGVAALGMGVPGSHNGHTAPVIIDMGAAANPGIRISGRNYITVDGYTDPRPHGGNMSSFIIRDTTTALEGQVAVVGASRYCEFKHLDVYQSVPANSGDGFHLNKGIAPTLTGDHLIEECYIHDLGYWDGAINYAGVWVNRYNNVTVRWCEFYNCGWGAVAAQRNGEGIGASSGTQTGVVAYHNTFRQTAVAIRSIGVARFNTVYSCEFALYVGATLGETCYFENNIFAHWNAGGAGTNSVLIAAAAADSVRLSANVFIAAGAFPCDADIHGTWYNTMANLAAEADALLFLDAPNRDGLATYFLNAAAGDFHLTLLAENAIDLAYITNFTPVRDFIAGRARCEAWDIGGYESLTACPVATDPYRFVSPAAAGTNNGYDWANAWSFASIDWAELANMATYRPVYLFLDQGTYTTQLAVGGSGTDDTLRIYIMPGYAANDMGIPGSHFGHTGAVVIDTALGLPGISIDGRSYITVSGYTDPRPHVGNDIHFSIRDTSSAAEGMVSVLNASVGVQLKRLNIYQNVPATSGAGINFDEGGAPPSTGTHLVEECWIHDLGYWDGAANYWGVYVSRYHAVTVRYCEFYNCGWGAVAAQRNAGAFGAAAGNQTGLVAHHNTARQVGIGYSNIAVVRFNTVYNCEFVIYVSATLGETNYFENLIIANWNAGGAGTNSIFVAAAAADNVRLNKGAFIPPGGATADCDIHGVWYNLLANLAAEADALLFLDSANFGGAVADLVNPGTGDFRLAAATPELDVSYTANFLPTRDLANNGMIGTTWDVGALERQ